MKYVPFFLIVFVFIASDIFANQNNAAKEPVKQEVTFQNEGVQLTGTLYLPSETDQPVPAVIALHGAGAPDQSSITFEHLKDRLPELGIAVLVFDRRGHGESEGDFQTADYYDLAGDAISGMDKIAELEEIDENRIGFWGISQGGWIAPLASSMTENAAFCISVVGPAVTPAEQMIYSDQQTLKSAGFSEKEIQKATNLSQQMNDYFRGQISHSEIQEKLKQGADEDWYKYTFLPPHDKLPDDATSSKWYYEFDYDPIPALKDLQAPALYIYGDDDSAVPVAESIDKLRKNISNDQQVSWYVINGANHIISRGEIPQNPDEISPFSIDEYHAILESWLKHHLRL